MDKRWGISRFAVEIFLSHSAKKIREEPFNVSEHFGYRKILCIRRGFHCFLFFFSDFFVSQCRKILWRTIQCFRKLRLSKNFMHKKGISLFSVENFLSHSAEKIRKGTLLCFKKILVSKIFMHRRGGITVLSKKVLSHRTETKNRMKNDSGRVRTTRFSSSRFRVRVSVVANIFTTYA